MAAYEEYALGRTAGEYARLARQSEILAPITQRAFETAGIVSGMRVLDLGSGAGDVCMLLARLVGPEGRIIGLDLDGDAIQHARERAAAAGLHNVEFEQCRFADYASTTKVDAIVGRYVLMYQPDPAAALASVLHHLRPDGIVAFLEPWFQAPGGPESHIRRAVACIVETLRRSGAHLDIGPRMHRIFTGAGLPVPEMRCESPVDAHAGSPLCRYVADTVESLLPKAIEYGLATAETFNLETLASAIDAEMQLYGYAMFGSPVISAWCRTPAQGI